MSNTTDSHEMDTEDFINIDALDTDVGAYGCQEATGVTTDGIIIRIIHWLV
jgi:hypothetical protein